MGKITDMDFGGDDDKACEYDADGNCIHHGSANDIPRTRAEHQKVLEAVIANIDKAAGMVGQTGLVVVMGKQILGSIEPVYGQMDAALRPLAEALLRTLDTLKALRSESTETVVDNANLS